MTKRIKCYLTTKIILVVFSTFTVNANEVNQNFSELGQIENLDYNEYGKMALDVYQQDFKRAVEYLNKNIKLNSNNVRPF